MATNGPMPLSDPALASAREILRREQALHIGDAARAWATMPTVFEIALDALQWRKKFEPTDAPGVVRRGLWKFEREVEEERIRMAEELIRRVEPGPSEDANYFALLAYEAASVEICMASTAASGRTAAGGAAGQRASRFLLGTVHAARVNAFARVLRHLDFTVVLIHSALVDFMYQAAKAVIAACNPVRSYDGRSDIQTSPKGAAIEVELDRNPEPVERLYRTLEAYYFRGYPRAFANEYVGEESHPPLGMLIALSERFVIAHEYGHGSWINLGSQLIDSDNPEWTQEFLADQFGMFAMVSSGQTLDAVDPAVSLSAATFALACLSVLARGLSLARDGVIPDNDGSKSHPPSRMRAEQIVAGYHKLFKTEFRPDGRGCVAVPRSQPFNSVEVDHEVREYISSGAFEHANALFTIWKRVRVRLLRDFQSGRRLHSMWAAADS